MSLYYVRHGQTDWNVQHLLQGRTDIPLNETGILQAKQTSELFQDIQIDTIFCSPLQRAVQTAKIIQTMTQCEIQIEPRIAERCFGTMEGCDIRTIEKNIWDFEQNLCSQAESMNDFFKRVQSFLEEIDSDLSQKNYCIVAHGGVFLPTYEYFNGLDHNSDLMQIVPKNCTITKFK